MPPTVVVPLVGDVAATMGAEPGVRAGPRHPSVLSEAVAAVLPEARARSLPTRSSIDRPRSLPLLRGQQPPSLGYSRKHMYTRLTIGG